MILSSRSARPTAMRESRRCGGRRGGGLWGLGLKKMWAFACIFAGWRFPLWRTLTKGNPCDGKAEGGGGCEDAIMKCIGSVSPSRSGRTDGHLSDYLPVATYSGWLAP